jgi:hypothetical protein
MTTKQLVINEINRIPKSLLNEVLDFIYFLEAKSKSKERETAILSETSLKKDWLKPEEDKAWANL